MGTKSLLLTDRIQITDDIYVKIPSVGDVLRDEEAYYDIVVPLTSMPIDYMAPLAKMGKDFECVRPYELFKMLFMGLKGCDMSNVFGDLDTSDFDPSKKSELMSLFIIKFQMLYGKSIFLKRTQRDLAMNRQKNT